MIDPNHLYTVHDTYTGKGCAMCGLAPCDHESLDWLVNGNRVEDPLEQKALSVRRKALDDLARAEYDEGIYDKIPDDFN